jgi:hypothetical protein
MFAGSFAFAGRPIEGEQLSIDGTLDVFDFAERSIEKELLSTDETLGTFDRRPGPIEKGAARLRSAAGACDADPGPTGERAGKIVRTVIQNGSWRASLVGDQELIAVPPDPPSSKRSAPASSRPSRSP